ncbi:MAG TPA: SDR family NAD(P)-dependent oxidoreductase [Frankiaceae bacterium]|jgi:NAD(P)-dependent dehydrogenase (short-subunit alcohol dehydrogenase family)|nr:SDR family NAD(P)-dependent oxidoreductase [Frankiaceae bacterium]
MAGRFAGRRALVTGASRGIGAGIAERLAAEGADIVITARTLDKHDHLAGSLRETESRLSKYGTKVGVVVADLTSEADRARVVPEAVEFLGGPVEILVNNAAAAMYAPLAQFKLKRARILFEANVLATLDLAQDVIPDMQAAGEGWIINVGSGSAKLTSGPPFNLGSQGSTISVYGASKAALNRITNGLGAELYGTGIRVNTVEPRAAVLSEGAAELVGGTLKPEQIESMEEMVEGVMALCDCSPDITARITVSLDLIADWKLTVHNLDGSLREA